METLFSVMVIIWLFMVCLAVWNLVCNERTHRQRLMIINFIFGTDEGYKYRLRYDNVTYGQHLWTLFRFGDPMDLYGIDFSVEFDQYKRQKGAS